MITDTQTLRAVKIVTCEFKLNDYLCITKLLKSDKGMQRMNKRLQLISEYQHKYVAVFYLMWGHHLELGHSP